MAYLEKKIKFLATKLTSLQAELKVSREIMTQASRDVNNMFNKKYFPEIPVEPTEKPEDTEMKDYSEEEAEQRKAEAEGQQEQQEESSEEQQEQKSEQNKSAEKRADPEVKRLFKKVAALTHPDKLSGLSEYEKKRKQDLFKKAMLALESNDLVSLADVAIELDLEAPDLSKERLKETENKIIAIKKELHHIESTYVWRWFFCEDKEDKDKILTELFGIMYANHIRS